MVGSAACLRMCVSSLSLDSVDQTMEEGNCGDPYYAFGARSSEDVCVFFIDQIPFIYMCLAVNLRPSYETKKIMSVLELLQCELYCHGQR